MKYIKIIGLICLGMLSTLSIINILAPIPKSPPFQQGQVEVIAHQGGNLESPDATFIAFDHAVNLNVDVLEMDVHLSKDGYLIVMHDEAVDRTTNGEGLIRDKTLAELKRLDAAYWWPYHANNDVKKQKVPAEQNFPYRATNVQIPTLDEMFERYPQKRFVIELKDNSNDLRDALLLKISEYDRWKHVVIASAYLETLQAVRETEPKAQTYGAKSEIRLFYLLHLVHLEKLYPYKHNGFAIPMQSGGINLATPRFVRAAKNAGFFLHYWTINNESDMKLLMSMGVDGLMTDRPKLLMQIRNN